MTSVQVRKIVEAIVRRSTRAQGLPLKVDDPRVLDTLAEMFGSPESAGRIRAEGGGRDEPTP